MITIFPPRISIATVLKDIDDWHITKTKSNNCLLYISSGENHKLNPMIA